MICDILNNSWGGAKSRHLEHISSLFLGFQAPSRIANNCIILQKGYPKSLLIWLTDHYYWVIIGLFRHLHLAPFWTQQDFFGENRREKGGRGIEGMERGYEYYN